MPDDNTRMLPDKGVVSDLDARIALKEGVDTVANAVKATMGPKGRNVVYKPQLGSPRVTNDGVTVARDIKIENTFLHTGAAIVYEACMMTNNVAGDGTTTAAVLTQAMNDLAFRAIVGGANPMIVRRGMVPALAAAEAALQAQAVTVGTRQDIAWIAGLSANDREVGELIGEVFERQGPEGAVTVTDGQSLDVEVRYVDGARIETGLLSPHFANDETGNEAEFEDCDVLLTDRKVTRLREFLPFLERYVESGRKRLFFLGREIGGDVLSAIIANHQRGILSAICLKSPTPLQHRLRWLAEDLAIATGPRWSARRRATRGATCRWTFSGAQIECGPTAGRRSWWAVTAIRTRSGSGSSTSGWRTGAPRTTTTERSCKNAQTACRDRSPRSSWAPPLRWSGSSSGTGSRMRSRLLGRASKRVWCPAAARRWRALRST